MNTPFQRVATITASTGIASSSGVIGVGTRSETVTLGLVSLFQLEWGPHLAALVGIVVLALLGGVLMARNRFAAQNTFVATSKPHDEEFLTDQERVQQLVREHGGRMKQSKIVDSVDWSKAKVSRLLAELEEDGRITKLRLGRENLVCLPGHEPTASQTPEQPKSE
ncbi:helix-turn-helix transcriptional regulator [Natronorubrum sulfidifaciens]|uniref:DUF7343 domain-containing protein n=1 Tax=Natronorubrum sulfidifaciens JCM 14089 TaxID=1230460 RepID=L9WK55_9EURY|nr:hypothetical protein [Natronorubrum sulfidifaciens]ELY49566.1 hypothetical protein C495_00015 [Natronorubrum sulfidifaciens JCM 14089]